MEPKDHTNGEAVQSQSPELQNSGSQAAEPDRMKIESPRKCRICGGPNHYGCGCEARQKKAAVQVATENIKPAEQGTAEAKSPDEAIEDILTSEAILEAHEANIQMTKDIKTMADGFEGLCACLYDTNQYLKLLAGDVITIRKFLNKEDSGTEPQDAT